MANPAKHVCGIRARDHFPHTVMDEAKAIAATTQAPHLSPARSVMTESPCCTFAAIPYKSESATREVDAPGAAARPGRNGAVTGVKWVVGVRMTWPVVTRVSGRCGLTVNVLDAPDYGTSINE